MPRTSIREARPEDAELLLRFIRELALYDDAPERVCCTADDLRRDGFGPARRFEALIAEVGGEAAGYALFYPSYTAWAGTAGLFLEDLYLDETARGHGVGRRLMAELAALCRRRGWTRIDLRVRADNRARRFYQRIGTQQLEGWLPCKLAALPLDALADEACGLGSAPTTSTGA